MWKTLQLLAAPGLGYGLLAAWATDHVGERQITLRSAADLAPRFYSESQVSLSELPFVGSTGLWLGRIVSLLLVVCIVGLVGTTYFKRPPRRIHLALCAALGATLIFSFWFTSRITSTFLEPTFAPWLTAIALLAGAAGTGIPLVRLDEEPVGESAKPFP